jgi:ribosomal protein S18 acetylase RimI-like enzyme
MTIREVTIEDVYDLQNISKQTFEETFSHGNTEENLKQYVEENLFTEKLEYEISNPNSVFYFAIDNNHICGYLKLNYGEAQTELKDDRGLEIERIYVLKEYHGKKVGQLLYNKALDVAHDKQVEFIWLGVWEENQRAISFYKKNDFIEFDKHIFKFGDEEQTDIMMKLQLR